MPWAAAIAAVGAIGGAVVSSSAASDAAETQAKAAKEGAAAAEGARKEYYTEAKGYLEPYATLGTSVLPALKTALGLDGSDPSAMMSMLEKYPGYQFALSEGQKGVNTAQIGMGGNAMQSMSPNAAKALTEYNQKSATGLYDNYVSKLFNFGNMGQAGASALANAALGVGTDIAGYRSDGITGAGNAVAAGQAAQGNIWGSTLTKLGQLGGQAYDSYDWSGNTGEGSGNMSPGDWTGIPQWGLG